MKRSSRDCDFLVIGTGLGGLFFALKAAKTHTVLICTKSLAAECNTTMAQGGVAAVLSESDSVESHTSDTITAGAGLCDPKVVREFVASGPKRIEELLHWGVEFDSLSGKLNLTIEGGHSHRRVAHSKDQTGLTIHAKLLELCLQNANIQLLEGWTAIDLISNRGARFGSASCGGALIWNGQSGALEEIRSSGTVLCTGGMGQVYLHTTNWEGATGDGVAMAYRAGAHISNLEFMQFHPTCFYDPKAPTFLITEALRGEGAVLVDQKGLAFMEQRHPLASLAPRDIVARGIVAQMESTQAESVFLDATHLSREFLQTRFPYIFKRCQSRGIDPALEPIPVVPAAHYACGGIKTDIQGRTSVRGLFAIGEVACTGLHGANRLASNSLLECLVSAHNLAQYIQEGPADWTEPFTSAPDFKTSPLWQQKSISTQPAPDLAKDIVQNVRRLMWQKVGIVRSTSGLDEATKNLEQIHAEAETHWRDAPVHRPAIEARNLALVAKLIAKSALARRESRGCHFVTDFPEPDPSLVGRSSLVFG